MFRQQMIECAHELAPRVNLEELRPLQRSPPVNAGQCFGHLFGHFCSQRLSSFESAGDVDHGKGILTCFAFDLIMRQKEEVSLVDLLRRGGVEFWSWNVPWSREVDLSDDLLLQPAPGYIIQRPSFIRLYEANP